MRKHFSSNKRLLPHGLVILHEDRDILVVDKPAGLLTMGTDRDKTRTAYFFLTDYVRKGYSKSRNRIFIVHRLDRETSGIVIFTKNVEAKTSLAGSLEKHRKEISRGRSRPMRAVSGDYHDLSGREQSAHRLFDCRIRSKANCRVRVIRCLSKLKILLCSNSRC